MTPIDLTEAREIQQRSSWDTLYTSRALAILPAALDEIEALRAALDTLAARASFYAGHVSVGDPCPGHKPQDKCRAYLRLGEAITAALNPEGRSL